MSFATDLLMIEYFENSTIQLFNLNLDIREQYDVSNDEPGIVVDLRGMLHRWLAEVGAQMPLPKQ